MAQSAPAGYSGTPLAKKLGYKPNCRAVVLNAPPGYQDWLQPLPKGVAFAQRVSRMTDLVHVFATEEDSLRRRLISLRAQLHSEAVVWVSWPKQSSKVPTTVTEGTVRQLALPLGFVDIKVCAVNEVWSGLKLVVRRELRPANSA